MDAWVPIVLSAATFGSTLLGGYLAIRSAANLRFYFAFSAGTLIAISFAHLLPEAIETSETDAFIRQMVYYTIILSFVFFHIIERYILVHPIHEHADGEHPGGHAHDETHHTGGLGATGLVIHSFVDGVAIGAAFQAGAEVGIVVALAVIAHDFADGVNTVTLALRVAKSRRRAFAFLVADSAAPVLGALVTLFLFVPQSALALILAFFVGHFLYIAAADLLPEMHRGERSWKALGVHLLGIAVILGLSRLITV